MYFCLGVKQFLELQELAAFLKFFITDGRLSQPWLAFFHSEEEFLSVTPKQ
jgi:hypothetical protein